MPRGHKDDRGEAAPVRQKTVTPIRRPTPARGGAPAAAGKTLAVAKGPGRSVPPLPERAKLITDALARVYPSAHCELVFANPLQLLVATILSAQCTDKRVNLVTETLFQRCRSAADYATIPQEELEDLIHSTGFYRNKAKNIRAMAADLVNRYGGRVPQEMDDLVALAGVGRKTANVVLGNAFGKNEGVVVDTHVSRLSQRLGLTTATTPEKIESDLMRLIPRDEWTNFSHWLIWHGRRRCTARNPDCPGCEIASLCPSAYSFVRKKAG